ncbi:uncharacterized protein FPRO_15439 [Fusarium proliferatum ET1]|uniref:Fungal N-terminal domain-containing protein n=1 Tax=Fusarium proliferatum (strain ET1) TaxID=1227346 RepID=A0A1L7VZE3_FUSPR|nr:uncharacterized protein FPRO_15439 [Fusarium proliferatum ET1]CZR45386.1 uncharacterized protein FPRO_15439 [Fusarium proliferatum ET1]
MEPISLVFEITSLSMQLVAMVKTIKGLVTAYKSAAQELEELCVELDDIETTCDCLGAALSQANKLYSRLLRQSIVSKVNQVIEKISAKLDSNRNPFKTIGGLFLLYRPQHATYVGSLERSRSSLDGIITTISFFLLWKGSQSSTRSIPVNQSLPRTGHFPVTPEFNATNHSGPPREKYKVHIKRSRRQCSSLLFLQKTQKSRIQDFSASNVQSLANTQESSTFTFGSLLLNTYIQLSIMRGSLAPFSVRLQIPRVLLVSEDATGVGESVRNAFESDDLQATQDLLRQGLLTTSTIVTYTEYDPENEASLLGLAMSLQSRKILNFLKDQMDLSEPRNHAACFSFPYQHPSSEEDFACILKYIHIRKELITPAEFSILLRTHEACRITAYVEACRQYFPYDWDRFDDVILSELSFGFSQLSARQMSNAQLGDWAPLFTDIVARSQDLVTNTEHRQFTATIYFIIWYAFGPDDAWYRLAIESCYDYWVETKARGFCKFEDSAVRRKLLLGHYKGREIPYWIEYVDNSCPIRELLTEFPALRYMDKEIRRTYWHERTKVYK